MTSGLVFEPMNGIQTNHAPNIDNRSQPSVLVPRSRSKRDLIGFNRQANNNFSHGRHWDNRMGTLTYRFSENALNYASLFRRKLLNIIFRERYQNNAAKCC